MNPKSDNISLSSSSSSISSDSLTSNITKINNESIIKDKLES